MSELEKQRIILKALLLYWNCDVCEKLGWKEECQDNKKECNFFVYDKLRDHIHEIDKIKLRFV